VTAFDFEQYARLPLPERIRICKFQAREARKLAALNNANQSAYLKFAEQWDTLAGEIEHAERSAAAQ
jgi:hypothetical protein